MSHSFDLNLGVFFTKKLASKNSGQYWFICNRKLVYTERFILHWKTSPRPMNLTLPVPIFYFHTSLWCLERFMKALKRDNQSGWEELNQTDDTLYWCLLSIVMARLKFHLARRSQEDFYKYLFSLDQPR